MEQAQLVALQALSWIAADDDLFAPFVVQSGLTPAELRARAAEPEVHGAVMDFILAEDSRVIAFAESIALAPEKLLTLRQALPGGDVPFWT